MARQLRAPARGGSPYPARSAATSSRVVLRPARMRGCLQWSGEGVRRRAERDRGTLIPAQLRAALAVPHRNASDDETTAGCQTGHLHECLVTPSGTCKRRGRSGPMHMVRERELGVNCNAESQRAVNMTLEWHGGMIRDGRGRGAGMAPDVEGRNGTTLCHTSRSVRRQQKKKRGGGASDDTAQ